MSPTIGEVHVDVVPHFRTVPDVKAEALREAADEMADWGPNSSAVAAWLRNRADQIDHGQ